MAEKKQYKVQVSGELADRILESMPETKWLGNRRVSCIAFVVETEGDWHAREAAIDNRETPTEEDEEAYLLDVMTIDEGTFPNLTAVNVTGKAWTVFP